MSRINEIQNAILSLDGGSFQKLFDDYLFRKYSLSNIHPLGSQTGTNKTTKGTPDSFVEQEDGRFILIMYGSVKDDPFNKLKKDILSCLDKDKLDLEKEKIERIICAYASTNIRPEQITDLKNLIEGIEIQMIGLGTISHDLLANFPTIANDHLRIPVDTGQFLSPRDFKIKYDKNGLNAPLYIDFKFREKELEELAKTIEESPVTLVTGASGVGKTKLVIEVLNKYEDDGYKVICVKNNGQSLFEDMRFYFSKAGKYILFLDDANQTTNLEYILEYISTSPEDISIQIVATVRDYAKKRLLISVENFFKPQELEIGAFANDEIKKILNTSLGIINSEYLDRIAKVAKGNARLAILAGKHSIDKGWTAIENALDIFHSYYGDILNSQKLDQQSISALFIIAFLGKVQIENNDFSSLLLSYFNISNEKFLNICHELNEKEIVDLFHDEVAQISDQSLSNYIIEYVLIEQKNIKISKILDLGFPKFKEKIIYNLNMLISLFNSNEIRDYIISEINSSWETAETVHQTSYLESFYSLNEEKSLVLVKKEIELTEPIVISLADSDFNKGNNKHDISTNIINILGGFKYSEYFTDAIILLLELFKKRPDLAMEFYFTFSEKLSYDEYSHKLDYKKEYILLETLYSHYKINQDSNIALLVIQILKEILNCEIRQTKSGDDNKSFHMITFSVVFSEGTQRLRKLIWENLSEMYSNDLYKSIIETILSEFHGKGMENKQFLKIFSFDLNCIEELFVKKWKSLTFTQAKVLKSICEDAERIEHNINESFKRYDENSNFKVYDILTRDRFNRVTWQEEEEERKKDIIVYTKLYTDEEYRNLFEFINDLELNSGTEHQSLGSGIRLFFESLARERFISVLKIYLEQNAPYSDVAKHTIITKLFEVSDFAGTKKLIESYMFKDKRKWLNWLWQTVPESCIDSGIADDFLSYIKKELELESPLLPNVFNLNRYVSTSPEIIKEVSILILENCTNNNLSSNEFLGNVYRDEDILKILELYVDNMATLKELYILCNNNNFDYNGQLFMNLLGDDYTFWIKYLQYLSDKESGIDDSYSEYIFKSIWLRNDYYDLIISAYDKLLVSEYGHIRESKISTIFPKIANMEHEVINNQHTWINSYIAQHYADNKSMKKLFNIISSHFEKEKIAFLLSFLSLCKDIDSFTSLPLFPMSSSWSVSEVPLIDRKITFLNDLSAHLKGIDYIEHRAYLKDQCENIKKYRKSVELREYIEDGNF